jgi:hypothetical protein
MSNKIIECKCYVAEVLEVGQCSYRVPTGSFSAPMDAGIRSGGTYARRFRLMSDFRISCSFETAIAEAKKRRRQNVTDCQMSLTKAKRNMWLVGSMPILAGFGLLVLSFLNGDHSAMRILLWVAFGIGLFVSCLVASDLWNMPSKVRQLQEKESQPLSQEDINNTILDSFSCCNTVVNVQKISEDNIRRVSPNAKICDYAKYSYASTGSEVGSFFVVAEWGLREAEKNNSLKRNLDGVCEIQVNANLQIFSNLHDAVKEQITNVMVSR